jgi:hypothetical protein
MELLWLYARVASTRFRDGCIATRGEGESRQAELSISAQEFIRIAGEGWNTARYQAFAHGF